MHRQRVIIHEFTAVVPQCLQQRFPGGHAPAAQQREENAVFRGGEGQERPLPFHLHSLLIDFQRPLAAQPRRILAQQRPDAAEQLLHPEGLGHIIVAPRVQAPNDIHFLIPGGEKQNGLPKPRLPAFPAQGHAVPVGQRHIQRQQIPAP